MASLPIKLRSRRIPELDGLRGSAAIIVVLYHAYPHGVFSWGWSGVDLFFVLSGFLITSIILAQYGSIGFLRSFYVRRVFRIWPVYYLTLGGVLLVNHFSSVGYPTTGLITYLCFAQNCQKYIGLPDSQFVHPFSPSWSVALEEQYYLFWPLLLLFFGRRSVPFLAAGLLLMNAVGHQLLPGVIDLLGTRGDGLAMGCFLAWLLEARAESENKRIKARSIIWIAGVVGCIYVGVYLARFWLNPYPAWTSTSFIGFSLLFFALIGLCVLYSGKPFLIPLRNPVLCWFGKISYAMYLFHLPLLTYSGVFLSRIGVRSVSFQNAVTGFLIVALPAASWYLLEQPVLRWKESLLHARLETKTVVQAITPMPRLTARSVQPRIQAESMHEDPPRQ